MTNEQRPVTSAKRALARLARPRLREEGHPASPAAFVRTGVASSVTQSAAAVGVRSIPLQRSGLLLALPTRADQRAACLEGGSRARPARQALPTWQRASSAPSSRRSTTAAARAIRIGLRPRPTTRRRQRPPRGHHTRRSRRHSLRATSSGRPRRPAPSPRIPSSTRRLSSTRTRVCFEACRRPAAMARRRPRSMADGRRWE
jgi:hypothetical protein